VHLSLASRDATSGTVDRSTGRQETSGVVCRWAACLLVSSALVTLTGFGGQAGPIKPGDQVGAMRLVKGTEATAHHKLFDTCDPVILRSGVYSRRCGAVPRVRRLFIGYGVFAPPREINKVWAPSTWRAWLDGRRIQLAAFGWSSRTLLRFPPAGGKDVSLREWRVMLLSTTPSRHVIRYRFRDSAGWIDATWKFTISAQ
jgi:hypothetical protein